VLEFLHMYTVGMANIHDDSVVGAAGQWKSPQKRERC
jgi:hypothetical protein